MNAAAPSDLSFDLPLEGAYLVEASAGTGKTYTLTAWVLRLLLEGDVPLRNLLAVTFTRAATADLRNRIRQRLRIAERALAGEHDAGDEATHTRALIAHARARVDEATLRLRLQVALLQLDEAGVHTIHGFCQHALREYGFLAGALGDEQVIDNADLLWEEVAADAWRVASNGDEEAFGDLARLWPTPGALAKVLPKLCDPARVLLPERGESAVAAWLHGLRADATARFERLLAERRQRTQDQLIERAWRASARPAFAAALKKRWPVMLVDEFQDTDPRQWAIFRAIHEAAAGAETRTGLFMIGDPKQAIYRFRGGDLPTYLEARAYAHARQGIATLTVNQRSSPALLQGVAAMFRATDHYRDAEEPVFGQDGIDFIPVEVAERNRATALAIDGEMQPGATVHWLPPDGPNANALGKRLAVTTTACEIVRLLEGGTLTDAKGERRLAASDIAVLVRTNDQAEAAREMLTQAGVAAAVLGGRSVFASEAADELLRLLRAFAAPSDVARGRAALATRLVGWPSSRIAMLDDGDAMREQQARFEQAGARWQESGPLPALLPFLSGNSSALLAEHGGSRLLTDAMHLAELLQAESPAQHGANGLLRWLERQWRDEESGEELALRMESDGSAVQIMTLHKSKGLEFPVVFLPFTAFGGGNGGRDPVKRVLARHAGQPAIYFHAEKDGVDLRSGAHQALLENEARNALAEDERLLYVGMTRAKFAVHFTAGCSRTQDFNGSPLKWLLFGKQKAGSNAAAGETKTATMLERMRARFGELSALDPAGLQVRDVPADLQVPRLRVRDAATDSVPLARVAAGSLPRGGGQYSFSGLRSHHRETLPARGADDEAAAPTPMDAAAAATAAAAEGVRLLGGADFGNVVHEVLEAADFAAWDGVVEAPDVDANDRILKALARHDLPRTPEAAAQVGDLVARALNAPLPGTSTLARLPSTRHVSEMEFHFRLGATRLPALHALLMEHGYARASTLSRGTIEGLMHGYIDLLYRDDDGAHWVLDYKTNRLVDYAPDACARAVADSDYDLQYLIYLVAVQRWLRLRLGVAYDPAKHLGGAVYLFVRGIALRGMDSHERPADVAAGIHRDRPKQALIDGLDALFDGGAA